MVRLVVEAKVADMIAEARIPLDLFVAQFTDMKARVDEISTDLRRFAVANEIALRLQTMQGIRSITASVMARHYRTCSTIRSARTLATIGCVA